MKFTHCDQGIGFQSKNQENHLGAQDLYLKSSWNQRAKHKTLRGLAGKAIVQDHAGGNGRRNTAQGSAVITSTELFDCM
jgi:hypothetical protein